MPIMALLPTLFNYKKSRTQLCPDPEKDVRMTFIEITKLNYAETNNKYCRPKSNSNLKSSLSGYHADTPITIKAEPSIWPTAALINIHEHPI